MRRKLRWISLALISCLIIPSVAFGEVNKELNDEIYINGHPVTILKGYDFDMSLISDMNISEEIILRVVFGDQIKESKRKVEISLSKGVRHVAGDLKFDLDGSNNYTDISISVKEYGEYYVSISVGDNLLVKEYSLEIYENYAFYGPKGNKMIFENIDEMARKLKEQKALKKPKEAAKISIKNLDEAFVITKNRDVDFDSIKITGQSEVIINIEGVSGDTRSLWEIPLVGLVRLLNSTLTPEEAKITTGTK